METMGPDLLAHVERRHGWFSDDEKPLLCAKHAGFCCWVEWCSSVQNLPADGVGGPPALDGPDVGAEDGLGLVPFVLEGFIVVSFIYICKLSMFRALRCSFEHSLDVNTFGAGFGL